MAAATYLFNDLPQGTFWVSVDDTAGAADRLHGHDDRPGSGRRPTAPSIKVTLTPTNAELPGRRLRLPEHQPGGRQGHGVERHQRRRGAGRDEPGIPGVTVYPGGQASGNVVATHDHGRQRQLHLLRRGARQLHRRGDRHGQRPGRLHADQRPGRHPGHGGRDRTSPTSTSATCATRRPARSATRSGTTPTATASRTALSLASANVTREAVPRQRRYAWPIGRRHAGGHPGDRHLRPVPVHRPAGGQLLRGRRQTTLPRGMAPTTGTTDPSAVINLSAGELYPDADFGYASADGRRDGRLRSGTT